MKNMMGTAGAKKAGSMRNQLKKPYSEFGHQPMYWANMEETAIHTARVTGWRYAGGRVGMGQLGSEEGKEGLYCGCSRTREAPSGRARP